MANLSGSSSLPEDLVIEILERLPVKSLLRYRCVSKSWCNLIRSSVFVDCHYARQGRKLMFLYPKPRGPLDFMGVEHLSIHDMDSLEKLYPSLRIGPIPKTHPDRYLLGPSRGLVCVVIDYTVVVCNPALRQSKRLPPLHAYMNSVLGDFHPEPLIKKRLWGWGFYTTCTDGFKVVVLWETRRQVLYQASMYHSTTNTWRELIGCDGKVVFPYRGYTSNEKGLLLNSTCHWLVEAHMKLYRKHLYPCSTVILTCDLSTEIMGYLEGPDLMEPQIEILMILNECLSMLWRHKWRDPYEIWVMEEYGVKGSWTKRYVIQETSVPRYVIPEANITNPSDWWFWKDITIASELLFLKNDEFLRMQRGVRLESWDLATSKMTIYKQTDAYAVDIYQESLISLL